MPQMNGFPSISERLVPRFNKRTFTFFISMVDIVVMLVIFIYAGAEYGKNALFDPQNEMAGPNAKVLYDCGGMICASTSPAFPQTIESGSIWRLLTPIFLHAGLVHLISNLFFQMHFGFSFELRWSTKRFIAVYFITGIGASLLSCMAAGISGAGSVSVGASGALFGLLGANVSYLIMNWDDIPNQKCEMGLMVMVVLMNFLFALGSSAGASATDQAPPRIDNWAHFGGLLTGMMVGPWLTPVITVRPKTKMFQVIAVVVWFIFWLSMILVIADPFTS